MFVRKKKKKKGLRGYNFSFEKIIIMIRERGFVFPV